MKNSPLLPFFDVLNTSLSEVKESLSPKQELVIESPGRILHEDIESSMPGPPFTRFLMDGYALRADDVLESSKEGPVPNNITNEFSGEGPSRKSIKPGIETVSGETDSANGYVTARILVLKKGAVL